MRTPLIIIVGAVSLLLGFARETHAALLAGTWSGSGSVYPKDGKSERVRCRITYRKESSKVYGVVATCASPSAKIRQTGKVLMVNETRYVGDFYNPDYDVSGRVRVIVSGSQQTVTFSGGSGRGSLRLNKR